MVFWRTVMKNLIVLAAFVVMCGVASGDPYHVVYDFETGWSEDYAPGWENSAYRHGPAPVGKMMTQVAGGYGGSSGMKLTADSVPESSMWWAAVNPTGVNSVAMQKQYDPWVSVQYYDECLTGVAGQVYAVPSWVNPYLSGGEDWTDIQFGGRFTVTDDYYYTAAGENYPGWQSTGVDRAAGWHELKMQLLNADGKIHFFLDGVEVGASYRNDYADLGSSIGLYTMFQNPLSGWGDAKPYTIWDNFEYGSSYVVPLPGAALLGMIGLVYAGRRLRKMV